MMDSDWERVSEIYKQGMEGAGVCESAEMIFFHNDVYSKPGCNVRAF
jgi:hypothetical protein